MDTCRLESMGCMSIYAALYPGGPFWTSLPGLPLRMMGHVSTLLQQESAGHLGNLTPEQWDALGEIWSFLLHLWYSEPSSPTRSSMNLRRISIHHSDQASQDDSPLSPTSPGATGTGSRHHYGSHCHETRPNGPHPASPTRLNQPFHQPSIASSPPTSNPPLQGNINGHNNIFLPGGAAAAAAALKRSATKLKPWLPSKKFTFKYSSAEYHTAFWEFVQSEHPDTTILRFLRARKWNVEKAMEMLILALEWRITMGVDEVVREGEEALEAKYPGFLDQLKNGKVIFRGHDRQGRPL
ncbi:hypothetical protein BX616_006164, partial [Lobosporangium transversale]